MCNGCNRPALWRCLDCQSSSPSCTECCRDIHRQLIFHRVQYWTGQFYEESWLLYTGLVLHLGHQGNPCPNTVPEPSGDSEGIALDESDPEEIITQDVGDPLETDGDGDGDWIDLPEEQSELEDSQPAASGPSAPSSVSVLSVSVPNPQSGSVPNPQPEPESVPNHQSGSVPNPQPESVPNPQSASPNVQSTSAPNSLSASEASVPNPQLASALGTLATEPETSSASSSVNIELTTDTSLPAVATIQSPLVPEPSASAVAEGSEAAPLSSPSALPPPVQGGKTKPLRLSNFANIYGPPSGCTTRFSKDAKFMTIIDKSGVHRVQVKLCQCPGSEVQREAHLLHAGLFPASYKIIKTAFTFAVLDDFRMSNLECKTSGYHYYRKLRRLTSPSFPDAVTVSAAAVLWLMMLSNILIRIGTGSY